jgi:hypothetical protein
MMLQKTLCAVFIIFTVTSAQEQEDESALFADTSSIVDSAAVVNTQEAVQDMKEKKTVGFSGEIYAYADPSFGRTWFDDPAFSTIGFSSRVVGNGLLDARLVGGTKAFVDMEAAYVPVPSYDLALSQGVFNVESGTIFTVREFFIDANYKRKVYLRAGKQVLQWGRCLLWNPTDLVNVEKKTFIQKMGHREGTYGLKVHVPYKTLFNFYSFINANEAATFHGLAAAVKAEVLVGRTEMALSMWGRQDRMPVFGFDFSSQLFEVQIAGEAAIRHGEDMNTLDMEDTTITDMGNTWIPRASLNLMKFFPLSGVADRFMVSAEFYYNHAGYARNIFGGGLGDYSNIIDTLLKHENNDTAKVMALYEANSYSKFYGMLSMSISRFVIDGLTFSCNVIGNLNQNCFVVSTGLSYHSLQNFIFGISLNAFVGQDNAEYTFSENGLVVQIQTGIMF